VGVTQPRILHASHFGRNYASSSHSSAGLPIALTCTLNIAHTLFALDSKKQAYKHVLSNGKNLERNCHGVTEALSHHVPSSEEGCETPENSQSPGFTKTRKYEND
jgi:hypothetical protein